MEHSLLCNEHFDEKRFEQQPNLMANIQYRSKVKENALSTIFKWKIIPSGIVTAANDRKASNGY